MTQTPLRLRIHVDGGSRGNPGPAAAGYVIRDAADEQIVREAGIYLGEATNNVAEYRGLVAALQCAAQLSAGEVSVFSDSELMVRQMNGQYRVRNQGLRPLFAQAGDLAGGFERFHIQHVRREKNTRADALVNLALDRRRDVFDLDE